MPEYPPNDPNVSYGYFVDPVEQKVGFGKVYGERSFNNCLVAPEQDSSSDLPETGFDSKI